MSYRTLLTVAATLSLAIYSAHAYDEHSHLHGGALLIPDSSLEHSEDVGVRAHPGHGTVAGAPVRPSGDVMRRVGMPVDACGLSCAWTSETTSTTKSAPVRSRDAMRCNVLDTRTHKRRWPQHPK